MPLGWGTRRRGRPYPPNPGSRAAAPAGAGRRRRAGTRLVGSRRSGTFTPQGFSKECACAKEIAPMGRGPNDLHQ
ncbi:hypothetical protein [Azospirillum largimobile]